VRESPAIALAEALLASGAEVVAHDPVAAFAARRLLGTRVRYVEDEYDAAHAAHAVVVATDWNEYKQLDFKIIAERMHGDLFFDVRNVCDPRDVAAAGLRYFGAGREGPALVASWGRQ
jgi:UDPglucose 6-dehydrogenase